MINVDCISNDREVSVHLTHVVMGVHVVMYVGKKSNSEIMVCWTYTGIHEFVTTAVEYLSQILSTSQAPETSDRKKQHSCIHTV